MEKKDDKKTDESGKEKPPEKTRGRRGPEPATIALLGLGGLALLKQQR